MFIKKIGGVLICASALVGGAAQAATNALSVGVWANFEYKPGDPKDREDGGTLGNEAIILYADGAADEGEGIWSYSAEFRAGPGSFTDKANNSTGDQTALHKAWVGFKFPHWGTLRVGKSQVPFGWKTGNFWPGDLLQAGYGDQMDVGLKLSGERQRWQYDLAYYHADDWGSKSTDTVDDNGHWGSSTTYRKVKTVVGNVGYDIAPGQTVAFSTQYGGLQDLTGLSANEDVDGSHRAWVAYYVGTFDTTTLKASYIDMARELPNNVLVQAAGNGTVLARDIRNTRLSAEISHGIGDWLFYLDATRALPNTRGSSASGVNAFAPGIRYDYGPGWIYLEYLNQTGGIDRNGQVSEGDFDAIYVSMDFYL